MDMLSDYLMVVKCGAFPLHANQALGAGSHSEKNKKSYKKLCYQAAHQIAGSLSTGSRALDLVTDCTVVLENSPLTNAGIGSNLTALGTVECDASVMEGKTCAAGAVGALSGVQNPVLVAKSLALEQAKVQAAGRVMPSMLVGDGAFSFAQDHYIPTVDPASMITAQSRKSLRKCKRKLERYGAAPIQRWGAWISGDLTSKRLI